MALLSSVFRRPSTIISLAVRTRGPARSFDRGFASNSFFKRFIFKGNQVNVARRWQEVEGSDEFPFKRTSFKGDGRKTAKTRLRKEFNHGIIQVTVDGDIDVDVDCEDEFEEAKKEDWRIPVKEKKSKTAKNSTQYRIKFNADEFIRVTVDDDLNEEEDDDDDDEDCSDHVEEEEDYSEEEEEEEYSEEEKEYSEEEDGDWQSFDTEMKKSWTEIKKDLHNGSEHNPKLKELLNYLDEHNPKLKELLNYLDDQGFSVIKSREPNLKKK